MIPAATVTHYSRVQRLQSRGVLAAQRAWASVDPGFLSESWAEAVRVLEPTVTRLQVDAAVLGASYGASTLAAQSDYVAPQVFVNPAGFAGQAADGRSLRGLLYSAAPHTKALIGGGRPVDDAVRAGGQFLGLVVKTLVADAGRAAAGVDTFARPTVGYVRMLNPPSCSRCSILAGKFYRSNTGFLRHPGCDCVHVPSKGVDAAKSEGLVHDPYEYFESLSAAEQDRLYGKANAQAIRDGGDIFQVVNSRRGMKPGGVTLEGTSRRGYWGSQQTTRERRGTERYGQATRARLTPEAIYEQRLPREQTIRMLEDYGYILPGGQNPHGVIRSPAAGFTSTALTAAEARVRDASLAWEAVQQGRNPYGKGPLTPETAARAENNYRRWLLTNGQIFAR